MNGKSALILQKTLLLQKYIQFLRKQSIPCRVAVYLIRFQFVVAQNLRPRAAEQEDFVFFGQVFVERMVAQVSEQCAEAQLRDADEDGGDVFFLHGFDDFRDIGAGFVFAVFAQKVVAAYADDDEFRLLQECGQTRRTYCPKRRR